MSSIGPALPPHLAAKRKRAEVSETTAEHHSKRRLSTSKSSDQDGHIRRSTQGPTRPNNTSDENLHGLNDSPKSPRAESIASSSEDSDDYGPAAAPADSDSAKDAPYPQKALIEQNEMQDSKQTQDEWMLVPPKADGLRGMGGDPNQTLRARTFNSGRGGRGPAGPQTRDMTWSETPAEKQQRLRDEVLGIERKTNNTSHDAVQEAKKRAEHGEKDRQVRKHKQSGAKSLLEQHESQHKSSREDDPSKRAFDYERDVASGTKMSSSNRNDVINRATNFTSKFSSGSYL